MVSLEKVEFVTFGPYKMVGKEIRTKGVMDAENPIPKLWQQCFSDGTYETLVKMSDYVPKETSEDYIGYERDYNQADGTFTYVVGMFMKPDTPVPEGFAAYDIPQCRIARAWIKGEEFEIYPNSHQLTMQAIKENGYEVDWKNYFSCEVYTDERFAIPKNNGEKVLILDYYMPCKKN